MVSSPRSGVLPLIACTAVSRPRHSVLRPVVAHRTSIRNSVYPTGATQVTAQSHSQCYGQLLQKVASKKDAAKNCHIPGAVRRSIAADEERSSAASGRAAISTSMLPFVRVDVDSVRVTRRPASQPARQPSCTSCLTGCPHGIVDKPFAGVIDKTGDKTGA